MFAFAETQLLDSDIWVNHFSRLIYLYVLRIYQNTKLEELEMATTSFKKIFRVNENDTADRLINDLESAEFGVDFEEVDHDDNKEKEEVILEQLASA